MTAGEIARLAALAGAKLACCGGLLIATGALSLAGLGAFLAGAAPVLAVLAGAGLGAWALSPARPCTWHSGRRKNAGTAPTGTGAP